MVLYTAKPLLSLPMLLSLDPFPLLFSMWYMHSMLRGHVSVCVCVRMCACILLYRMCFLLLAWRWALPHDWLIAPVMSRRAQLLEWESRCAPLLVSVLVCVCWRLSFFFLCGWSSPLVIGFFGTCPPQFWAMFDFSTELNLFQSLVFSKCVFQTMGMFPLERGLVAWLHCAVALQHKDWLFPPSWPFLPSSAISPSSAHHLDPQSLSVASVNMQ